MADIVVWEHTAALTDPAVASLGSPETSFAWTLWTGEVPGGLIADRDFWSLYQGSFRADVSVFGDYDVTLTTVHVFGDGSTLTQARSQRVVSSLSVTVAVPMAAFGSITQIRLGSFADSAGVTVTVTQAMLDGPSTITQTLTVDRADGQTFSVGPVALSDGEAVFRQFGAASAALDDEVAALERRVERLEDTPGRATYGNPSASLRDAVRFLVNDTDPANARIADTDIDYLVDDEPGRATEWYAYRAMQQIAVQLTAAYDVAVGDLKVSLGQQAKAATERVREMLLLARRREAGRGGDVTATGDSRSEKRRRRLDSDRVRSRFRRDQFDDPLLDDDYDISRYYDGDLTDRLVARGGFET